MKILVTGGCGFIGSHIVDTYIDAGHTVVVADKAEHDLLPYKNKKAIYYKIDLTNSKRVIELIEKEKPEIINHHSANISLTKSIQSPLYDAKNNITTIINLLNAAKINNIKKIIFASSAGALYSDETQLPFTEKTVTNPISPYGVSKLACEQYIRVYTKLYGIKHVILRYSNVYGPRQSSKHKSVISVFIDQLRKNKRPTINNDGLQTRDFLFVEDVKTANLLALDYNENDFFNISSYKEVSIIKTFNIIKSILRSNIESNFKNKAVKEQQRSYISNQKAKIKLGWKPKYSFKKGLIETIMWYEKFNS